MFQLPPLWPFHMVLRSCHSLWMLHWCTCNAQLQMSRGHRVCNLHFLSTHPTKIYGVEALTLHHMPTVPHKQLHLTVRGNGLWTLVHSMCIPTSGPHQSEGPASLCIWPLDSFCIFQFQFLLLFLLPLHSLHAIIGQPHSAMMTHWTQKLSPPPLSTGAPFCPSLSCLFPL